MPAKSKIAHGSTSNFIKPAYGNACFSDIPAFVRATFGDSTPSPLHADAIIGQHPPERLRLIEQLRWISFASVVALIILGLLWELKLAPLPGGSGALAIKVLPLSFALTGLLKHKLYTYRWLSLLVWLYFTEGVVRATGDHGLSQQLAIAETALSVTLFAACAMYVRLRLRVLPKKAKNSKDQAP